MGEKNIHARGERGQIDPSEPRRCYADKCRAYYENGQLVLFNTRTARLAKVDPRLPILLNASNGGAREQVLSAVKDQMDPEVAAAMLDQVAEHFTREAPGPHVPEGRPCGIDPIPFIILNLCHSCTMECKYCNVDHGDH